MVSYTFEIDEKDKAKFEKIADSNHRTMAAQLRYLIEGFISDKIDIKEADSK